MNQDAVNLIFVIVYGIIFGLIIESFFDWITKAETQEKIGTILTDIKNTIRRKK